MHKLFIVLAFITTTIGFSQELNCTVTVISQQTGNENNVVFKTLEKQLTEFVNTTKWTEKTYNQQERISCSMVINVKDYSNNLFSATLQVSSSRPIFNSSYNSPVYNFNDKDFNFKYLEYQNLVFNPTQFESNLVSILAFHAYMILGIDADTFALNGGSEYFKEAQTIVNYSQQLSGQGWKLEDGLQSRFSLIDNLLSTTYKEFRSSMYNYHIKGLDLMSDNQKAAKTKIVAVFSELRNIHSRRPNSFLMRVFFDAKADEIIDIFSGGPSVNIAEAVNVLNKIAPIHSQKWRKIKY
ncbi:MAG: DUF4835 family protein [Winogradskyella sp.]